MNNKVALFEKVSYEQFKKDWESTFSNVSYTDEEIKYIYDGIKLPERATVGSAGYDFVSPISFTLFQEETIKIPTGIRCSIDNGWVLMCYPRSSMGFKYRMQIDNTCGIIDSDYYNANNEGHIFFKISCDSYKAETSMNINEGDAFVQGIFVPFGITKNDDTDGIRYGGIGSTSK